MFLTSLIEIISSDNYVLFYQYVLPFVFTYYCFYFSHTQSFDKSTSLVDAQTD